MARTSYVVARARIAHEIRVLRGGYPRKYLARRSGVELSSICIVEHGNAHMVPIRDLLAIFEGLRCLTNINQERERLIRDLIRVINGPRPETARVSSHSSRNWVRR